MHWPSLTTAEKREAIEPLWLNGYSAGMIAQEFTGASRNAVVGALNRAGLLKIKGRVVKVASVKRHGPPKLRLVREPMMLVKFPFKSTLDLVMKDRPPLDGHVPISLLELPYRMGVRCRFPVGDKMYCGADSGDRMYCDAHHGLMYQPTDKIRVPKEARL